MPASRANSDDCMTLAGECSIRESSGLEWFQSQAEFQAIADLVETTLQRPSSVLLCRRPAAAPRLYPRFSRLAVDAPLHAPVCPLPERPVLRHIEALDAVAVEESCTIGLAGDASVTIEFSRRDFAKISKCRKRSSDTPLSTLLTACSLPQRASRRSASTDRLSSVGLSNRLLVGRITIRVKGMTETCKTPATTHQNVAPASQAAIEDSRHTAAN